MTLYLLPAVLAVLILGALLVLLEGLARWIRAGVRVVSHILSGRGSLARFLMAPGDGRPYDLAPGAQDTPRSACDPIAATAQRRD